jgi:ATP-dependent Zn protease
MESEGSTGATVVSANASTRDVLASEWRRLSRAATVVAVLTSPALLAILIGVDNWPWGWALLATIVFVAAFRGLIDIVAHRLIPRPSLYGADREALQDDATARRRLWFWRGKYKLLLWVGGLVFGVLGVIAMITGQSIGSLLSDIGDAVGDPTILVTIAYLGIQLPLLFFINFAILFGPLLYFGLKQMKGYEPGDADWGVRLEDVRGQAEQKEDVTRVIELWQSGEEFRKAGGKPERGLLFVGAPGTGKTMLSKAIATSFNSPIVTMPGSGFAQTFIGMDVVIVMMLIRKARKLARKWGGQCIIFIDEIDAVGLRRQALGTGMSNYQPLATDGLKREYYGPWGSLSAAGDVICETPEWREHLFALRAPGHVQVLPPTLARMYGRINDFIVPGGMGGGGGMALNQLLVQMDGVDEPKFWAKFWTNRINNLLDASYVVPRKLFGRTLRLRSPRPRPEQIYFIGATNVPIDRLDPALLRPGRMGRHVWFRTPDKKDRLDVFDLYLGKVAHEADLDRPRRRDELARITGGYSPAMIEQVCSMALTYAHSSARLEASWDDIVQAITTIESGTAQSVEYVPEQRRSVAIHEAGHAVAAHVYLPTLTSTRLSIRKRGSSLGHHQMAHNEDRHGITWRHDEVSDIVWGIGAMAAEHVFYGENSTGVGGDLGMITSTAAAMVGYAGMGPQPIDLSHMEFENDAARREAEQEYMARYERIGEQVLNRSRGMRESGDPIAAILMDPFKRRVAAQIVGQAYITAVCVIRHNRDKVAYIADVLVERREIFGDEVIELLEGAELEAPTIDITDETIWPKL